MAEKKRTRGSERKDQDLHMRFTKSQMDLLEMLSYEEEKNRTDTVVKALTWYSNFKKAKIDDAFN